MGTDIGKPFANVEHDIQLIYKILDLKLRKTHQNVMLI
jgi:hypothetical protein